MKSVIVVTRVQSVDSQVTLEQHGHITPSLS